MNNQKPFQQRCINNASYNCVFFHSNLERLNFTKHLQNVSYYFPKALLENINEESDYIHFPYFSVIHDLEFDTPLFTFSKGSYNLKIISEDEMLKILIPKRYDIYGESLVRKDKKIVLSHK